MCAIKDKKSFSLIFVYSQTIAKSKKDIQMKNLFIIALSSLALTAVQAEGTQNNGPYIDLGYSMLTYSDSGTDFKPGAVRIVIGMNSNNNFGYEGMLGAGVASDQKSLGGVATKLSIPTFYGLYGKAFANITNEVEVFGRLGWAGFNRETTPQSTGNTGSGLSYGVGAKFAISKSVNVSADYMSYYPTKNTVGLSGFTLGAGFNF